MSEGETKTLCVFSDLHLFCGRSEAKARMDKVHEAMDGADLCVWNGDMFDFRWTEFDSIEATVPHAFAWIEEFMARYPGRRIHYVLGNHDAVGSFVEKVRAFEKETPNFTCHTFGVRFDHTVFLHGDMAHFPMTKHHFEGAFRDKWWNDKKKGKLVNWLFDRGFDLGLHKRVHRMAFPPRVVARRVLRYLDEKQIGPDAGTTDVYLGHTHVALPHYEHGGVTFHNTGAPMPGLEFHPLTTTVASKEAIDL